MCLQILVGTPRNENVMYTYVENDKSIQFSRKVLTFIIFNISIHNIFISRCPHQNLEISIFFHLLPPTPSFRGRGLYFEPNFQENGRESAKTVGNGIVQHEILYHFSFDTIGKKSFFNFFF